MKTNPGGKDLPYYKLWVKDFDTNEAVKMLTLPELGLFILCLNHAWVNDGLPINAEDIARALKLPTKEFSRHWKRVAGCFADDGAGRLRNKRQEEERDEAKKVSRSAQKSARLRWDRNASGDAIASTAQCEGTARASDYGSGSENEFLKGGPGGKDRRSPDPLISRFREVIALWQQPYENGKVFSCDQVDLGYQVWMQLVELGTITSQFVDEVILPSIERHRASKKWREGYVPSVPVFFGWSREGRPSAPRWSDRPEPAPEKGEY